MPTRISKRATDRSRGAGASAQVTVQLAIDDDEVPSAARLRRWVRAASPARAEITVRVVGTREGRRLNRSFRGIDHATNVLSFPYGTSGGTLAGDLVLCAPVIRREAREQSKALAAHYAHLTVHGVLHLRGYLHDDDEQAERMEKAERRILRGLGYPDPYLPADDR
jgi:probable rRNA maturation factor